jgi:hypothetical protein
MNKNFYLLNAFSPSMFADKESMSVYFQKLTVKKARDYFNYAQERGYNIISAIGHEGTARLLSQILNHDIPFDRKQISLSRFDCGLIITLAFRPEDIDLFVSLQEGRVYSYEELMELFAENKIVLYFFTTC